MIKPKYTEYKNWLLVELFKNWQMKNLEEQA